MDGHEEIHAAIALPASMKVRVELSVPSAPRDVFIGDKQIEAQRLGSRWALTKEIGAPAPLEVR